jgi:hypothetical protein
MKKSFSARATPRKIVLDDEPEEFPDSHNTGTLNVFCLKDEADLTSALAVR